MDCVETNHQGADVVWCVSFKFLEVMFGTTKRLEPTFSFIGDSVL